MSMLVDLPGEIVALLAFELSTEDFFNLRLTCRDLVAKSFSEFLSRYFTVRFHMLERRSLHNLLEVSAHPVFGPAVRTLEICVDHLVKNPPGFQPSTWLSLNYYLGTVAQSNVKATVNKEEYRNCWEDQERLSEQGLDTAYLTRALANLVNCKTVCIDDTHRPWGAVSQKRKTGLWPTSAIEHVESFDYMCRLIKVVLAAVMASQISLDLLEISPGFNREAIGTQMLPRLPDLCVSQPMSRFTCVTSLALMINPDNLQSPDFWAEDLICFLELFPALEGFTLKFHKRDDGGLLGTLSFSLRLQSLRVLSIDSADCTEDELATLFLNHKDTLREIHLSHVVIIQGSGSWTSLERTVKEQLSVEKFSHVECV